MVIKRENPRERDVPSMNYVDARFHVRSRPIVSDRTRYPAKP